MKKSVIIFDFDGTIADSLPAIIDIINSHSKQFGIPILDSASVEELRGMNYQQILKKYHIPLYKLFFWVLISQRELHKKIDKVLLFPGMKEVISQLKENYRLGILTTDSKENVQKFLANNQLEVFEFIQAELNLFGKDKALLGLLKKLKLSKDEVIYIGDEVRDIEACQRASIDIISVSWGFNTKEFLASYQPVYLVEKPSEVVEILSKK
jgi:phosphoglycolate phosphatase